MTNKKAGDHPAYAATLFQDKHMEIVSRSASLGSMYAFEERGVGQIGERHTKSAGQGLHRFSSRQYCPASLNIANCVRFHLRQFCQPTNRKKLASAQLFKPCHASNLHLLNDLSLLLSRTMAIKSIRYGHILVLR